MLSPSSPRAISSTASCTRCRVVKSQFTPSNSGLPLFKRTRGGFSRIALGKRNGEGPLQARKYVSTVADELHRKMAVRWQDLAVGAPQVALARGEAINAFADLDIGKILTERQHLAAQELDAMAAIGPVIIAVGGLGSIDVPGIERIALAGDLQHFLERRRDDGTAGLATIEEGLLVDLLGRAGMADEDDVDGAVAPLEEDVEEHEETLGKILHRLGHRAGDVHQAEHHRLGVRPRHAIEPVVADVDRVDIGDQLAAALQHLDLRRDTDRGILIAFSRRLVTFPLERLELGGLRPAQRDAPGHAVAHGAADAEVGRRPRHRIAGAKKIGRVGLLQRLLDQIRQLEILEEHVEELFAGEGELEGILARTVGTALRAAAATAVERPQDLVADDVFLVAWHHVLAASGAAQVAEGRLADSLGRDRHLLAAADIRNLALAQRRLDRRLQLTPGACDEALAIAEALALRVGPPVDDVHRCFLRVLPRLPGLVDPHIPFDEPAHLALRIAARHHPGEKLGVLLLGLRVFLRAEADDRQEILDLAEHPPFDDLTQLLVRGPGRIAA